MSDNARYHGRRFRSLIFVAVLLTMGFYLGDPAVFGAYSTGLGAMYTVYLAGQTATNWQKAKNGG